MRCAFATVPLSCGRAMIGSQPVAGSTVVDRCVPNPSSRCGRRSLHCACHTCSDISSNATTILRVGLAVMPGQISFFAQDLAVEQPYGRAQINQSYPIWEDEEFSYQD